jgi:hypothetical protein
MGETPSPIEELDEPYGFGSIEVVTLLLGLHARSLRLLLL